MKNKAFIWMTFTGLLCSLFAVAQKTNEEIVSAVLKQTEIESYFAESPIYCISETEAINLNNCDVDLIEANKEVLMENQGELFNRSMYWVIKILAIAETGNGFKISVSTIQGRNFDFLID